MIYSNLFQYGLKIPTKKNQKKNESIIIFNLDNYQELEIYSKNYEKIITINSNFLKNSKIILNSKKLKIENKKNIYEIFITKNIENEFRKFFYFLKNHEISKNLKNPEIWKIKKIFLKNEKFKNFLKIFSQLYIMELITNKENLWKNDDFIIKKNDFENLLEFFLNRSEFNEIENFEILKILEIKKKKNFFEEDFFNIFFSGIFYCENSIYFLNYQNYKKKFSEFFIKSFFFKKNEKINFCEFEKKINNGYKYFNINLKFNEKKNILETFFFYENDFLTIDIFFEKIKNFIFNISPLPIIFYFSGLKNFYQKKILKKNLEKFLNFFLIKNNHFFKNQPIIKFCNKIFIENEDIFFEENFKIGNSRESQNTNKTGFPEKIENNENSNFQKFQKKENFHNNQKTKNFEKNEKTENYSNFEKTENSSNFEKIEKTENFIKKKNNIQEKNSSNYQIYKITISEKKEKLYNIIKNLITSIKNSSQIIINKNPKKFFSILQKNIFKINNGNFSGYLPLTFFEKEINKIIKIRPLFFINKKISKNFIDIYFFHLTEKRENMFLQKIKKKKIENFFYSFINFDNANFISNAGNYEINIFAQNSIFNFFFCVIIDENGECFYGCVNLKIYKTQFKFVEIFDMRNDELIGLFFINFI